MQVRTNHQWRDTIHWWELTAKEQAEFDWLDTEERRDEAEFVRYRGWCYCMDQFMRFGYPGFEEVQGWQAYHGDSYSSGVVIKLNNDGQIMIGTYTS